MRKPKVRYIVTKDGAECRFILSKCFGTRSRGFLAVGTPPHSFAGEKSALKAIVRTERLRAKLKGSMIDEQREVAMIVSSGVYAVKPV